jgi:hypothetical protein
MRSGLLPIVLIEEMVSLFERVVGGDEVRFSSFLFRDSQAKGLVILREGGGGGLSEVGRDFVDAASSDPTGSGDIEAIDAEEFRGGSLGARDMVDDRAVSGDLSPP